MRMTMVMALGFACAVSAWADDAPEVATAERIGLAYNQLGIGVRVVDARTSGRHADDRVAAQGRAEPPVSARLVDGGGLKGTWGNVGRCDLAGGLVRL